VPHLWLDLLNSGIEMALLEIKNLHARVDGQVHPAEDLVARDVRVQVLDLE